MKELGITKGEWQYEVYSGYYAIQNTSGYNSNDLLLADSVGSFEAEHNAELICDAGNTAQKCGLLPSELLQQRDELRVALQNACKFIKCTPLLKHEEDRPRGLERWESLIEAAIKNTDG